MNTQILSTEATLNTLSITIQSLVVSGKQVTLAVFRQFPEDTFISDEGTQKPYQPWGCVRYNVETNYYDSFRPIKEDFWMIAEVNGYLVRCPIKAEIQALKERVRKAPYNARETRAGSQKFNDKLREHQKSRAKYNERLLKDPTTASWLGQDLDNKERELQREQRNIQEELVACNKDERNIPTWESTLISLDELLKNLPQLFIAV